MHLSTFQPQKSDFAKHAQPQPKKGCAYKMKKSVLGLVCSRKISRYYCKTGSLYETPLKGGFVEFIGSC